jgi:RNA polymerase sigma-70 factor (ECF subfamily)
MEEDLRQHLDAGQYRAAFELLMDRFQDKVFRLACAMLRHETEAEDVTQEIFLRIWKALPGYHGGASLSTWIYTISRNACLTELKKRAAHPTVSFQAPEMETIVDKLPELHTVDPGPGTDADVRVMLDRLPEKYRQVITLFYLEEKSYEEVATRLDLPMGTVKTFIHRARKELLRLSARSEKMCA